MPLLIFAYLSLQVLSGLAFNNVNKNETRWLLATTCATSVSGEVASIKAVVVAAPIAPHVFLFLAQTSSSHGDLASQKDDWLTGS